MFDNIRAKSLTSIKNYTKKKNIGYRERDEAKRAEFAAEISSIPDENIVYVDEMGINQCLHRPYARAFKGSPVFGKISGKRFKRTSIVAAQRKGTIIAPLQYSGTMDSALFLLWFTTMLIPLLLPGSVVVMDNARFHCKSKLSQVAQKAGCRLLFLPSYSPDFNRIEFFWAWLKSRLRKVLPSFSSLDDAITDCFNA